MSLKDRIKAESTEFGKICKTWLAGSLALLSIVGSMAEYLNALPTVLADQVPGWLKHAVLAAGVLSFIYGHWSVKQKTNEQV